MPRGSNTADSERWGPVTGRLRRTIRRAVGALGSRRRTEPERRTPRVERTAGETRSEADLLLDEGMTPRSYLYHLVEYAGGRTRQKHLVSESRLPESTVSRLLTDLESEEHLIRHRVGRENVVCLPHLEPSGYDPERTTSARADGAGTGTGTGTKGGEKAE